MFLISTGRWRDGAVWAAVAGGLLAWGASLGDAGAGMAACWDGLRLAAQGFAAAFVDTVIAAGRVLQAAAKFIAAVVDLLP